MVQSPTMIRSVLFCLLLAYWSTVGERRGAAAMATATVPLSQNDCQEGSIPETDNEGKDVKASTSAHNQPTDGQHKISDGTVHELGVNNFAPVIGSSSYALVLFYDRDDASEQAASMHTILDRLAETYARLGTPKSFHLRNLRLSFAKIDIRRHFYIRTLYDLPRKKERTSGGVGAAWDRYYKDYDDLEDRDEPIQDGMISFRSFMAPGAAPHLASRWVVFYGKDYNVLDYVSEKQKGRDDFSYVKKWFASVVKDTVHYAMEGLEKPKLPFRDDDRGRPPESIESRLNTEERFREEYANDVGAHNSLNLTALDEFLEQEEEAREEQLNTSSQVAARAVITEPTDLRKENFKIWTDDVTGKKHFQYEHNMKVSTPHATYLMSKLGRVVELYLSWAESYEEDWDDARKARENEMTNYGYYLEQMNAQVKDMIFSVFEDLDEEGDQDAETRELMAELGLLRLGRDVPDLKKYYEEMVFGYGRSGPSLERYLQKEVYGRLAHEDAPTEAAADNNSTDGVATGAAQTLHKEQVFDNIALVQRIREYMRTREVAASSGEKDEDGDLISDSKYAVFFRTLFIKWHAILEEFHSNLTRHYVSYRESRGLKAGEEEYRFQLPDVVDMTDPKNFDLLSDYEAFQRKYVAQRTPVVLSNVALTKHNFTLDYLVEKCGFLDVTKSVLRSYRVGDENSVRKWGGLANYELPEEFMTETRKKWDEKEEKYRWDRRITFEQFVMLANKLDFLYLHDQDLRKKCSSLFTSQTPYDAPEDQYFRIPSVIGRYDLFMKEAFTSYQSTWPSLFVGRKGTNSKIHTDSGATGFWMFLVSGRKRWVMFDVAERPFLYERTDKSSFIADVLALNKDKESRKYFDETYPLIRRAVSGEESGGYEIIQEAGQLVYIPPSTPHAVENLEDIIGISFNLVPRAGVSRHLHDEIHGENKFASLDIALRYLATEHGQSLAETVDPLYTTLGEYMAQL